MTTIKFTEISKLKDEIDRALANNNFEEVNSLSNSLEAIVKSLVEDKNTTRNFSNSEINVLVKLLEDISRYEELTKNDLKTIRMAYQEVGRCMKPTNKVLADFFILKFHISSFSRLELFF